MATAASETTPLVGGDTAARRPSAAVALDTDGSPTTRQQVYDFLEAQTDAGKRYEIFMIFLILVNVIAFIIGSLFVEEYNKEPWAARKGGMCGNVCDALWFGNYSDNDLEWLGLGATSLLEIVTVLVFTVEYGLRLWVCDLEDATKFSGVMGRLRFIPTFFSLVDLASTLPFYIDAFALRDSDWVGSSFLRMFRLLRMMRVEGRYDTALTMVDDVFHAQKGIMGTALFVGFTTWMTVASLYYIVERKNEDLIYCGAAPDYCGDADDMDISLCTIDVWGFANCTAAGCPATEANPEPCYNLYQSIPMASYYALLNLFGEFPLIDQHSVGGKVVGTFTAVLAAVVFAVPTGIIGNGFEAIIEQKQAERGGGEVVALDEWYRTAGFVTEGTTLRQKLYNFLHAMTEPWSMAYDLFIQLLVIVTTLTFMLDTLKGTTAAMHVSFDSIEFFAVVVFTLDYLAHVYSVKEDPKYSASVGGRFWYMLTFLAVVDFLSVFPYWCELLVNGEAIITSSDTTSTASNLVRALRLLRILRFEKYTRAFTTFDDVLRANAQVLQLTVFTAMLLWVFFAAFLYITERDNPDEEMASNYNNVPNSMWMTLLNLSGEAPLCQYSVWGKVASGIIGLFATAIFGIPIGILGAGFEELVQEKNADNTEELVAAANEANKTRSPEEEDKALEEASAELGSFLEHCLYTFVNGIGSPIAKAFEIAIYALIFLAVGVGCWQTVEGEENSFREIEWIAVVVFTFEYVLRFIGAGADPEFAVPGGDPISCRIRFLFSFYSFVDLAAIIPFYVSLAMPDSIVDQYDEYLRMLRIVRLIKLDKYVPSISLIDDVIRLKANTLKVAAYAAATLWILFAALLYLFETKDTINDLDDPVPDYGCMGDCTMADRFQNFFDSMVYTGVHLTGDYPITTYTWPARVCCFFMVIAAVGVVSVPSGLIASGFSEIVQSRNRKRGGERSPTGRAGDDWYEISLRQLRNVAPPPSPWGAKVDEWQVAVNEFLNGKDGANGETKWTFFSRTGRVFIFTVIITNVLAVLLESIPNIDKAVGNDPGNFFDSFEAFSVFVFAFEYILRLFCAPKNKEALYSSWTYATTFFGIVDLLSTAPWFVEQALIASGLEDESGDLARTFRIARIFRLLQLEDFITAFSKLDNVFRASKDILKATGLMALIIWVGCGALFFIFEENNPNWRECDASIPLTSESSRYPGCYDFATTAACNEVYTNMCTQKAFTNMPDSLYYTAVFLGGEWGVIDFTWPGRLVCLFLCVMGIGLYAIPVGALFDSFGAVLGLSDDDDDEDEE
ncbi:gated channel subfamily KQT member 1 [Seminavis robusta]|uniref:Gated channel subfamily KQT member 1 n=1 Tax=Seminavis robusta TaxID=568900 RepID=A0A9N8E8Q2_9STRA|nr:gated channel subfamily KQT member 1 [Seminavis robusta]|eukprot:Sro671_g184910.1 gated channel subfamily KQT member 1 (1295) ;mRNA; f:32001-35981